MKERKERLDERKAVLLQILLLLLLHITVLIQLPAYFRKTVGITVFVDLVPEKKHTEEC